MFSNIKLKKKYKRNFRLSSESGAGFTIIEVLVVTAIIIVFSIILISNFPQFKIQFALSRTAYKFAQDVRRAQGMSLSSTQYRDSNGILQPVKGYGVYVDISNNKKYIIYADVPLCVGCDGNQFYDSPADYIAENIDFSLNEPGVIIQQINNIVGNNVSINFAPPNPTTTITPLPSQNSIDIVFVLEGDLTKTKTVSINTAGLIEVK